MRDSQHTAHAQNEKLTLPLRIESAVALDDAILTSPAVVAGRAYVVDQMGTAYCIDTKSAAIVWKTLPPGANSTGGNTSSPCIANGKMAYGTTAGNFYILDATTGKVVTTHQFDQSILGSITAANHRFYLQTLDGAIHCIDQSGALVWKFDPYSGNADSKRQYSGVPVAVIDDIIVAAAGFDLLCLRDQGTTAELVWTQRQPISNTYLPAGISISGDWAYVSFPGKDGLGAILRADLATGQISKQEDVLEKQWAILTPPATREGKVYYCRQAFGLSAARFGESPGVQWSSFSTKPESITPAIAAPTLTDDLCLFTLLSGELAIVPSAGGNPETISTPSGAVMTSSPAISGGTVCLGSDDGHLYILRGGQDSPPPQIENQIFRRRTAVDPAGDRRYGWPSAFGGPANANFVLDPAVKPPFRLRWATKSGGLFKQAVCATEEDVIYITLGGLVVCREQSTGRIRWRRHLPGQSWCRSALLAAEGRIFIPRMFSLRYPKSQGSPSELFCLSGETGAIEWRRPIGIGDRLRSSPVYADGVVAFGSLYKEGQPPEFFPGDQAVGQAIDAWDAVTGEPRWRVTISASGKYLNGPAGCAGDGVMFFTGGGEGTRDVGETVAINPRNGEVLWRSDQFASQTGTPSYQDGLVYLPGTYRRPMASLRADTGEISWTNDLSNSRWHVDTIALGPDYFSVNNKYKGGAWRWDLKTGQPIQRESNPLQLWGPGHGCGAIILTSSGHALSATINGLCATDANTGKLRWKSDGFGSYTCPHPIAANGRIFYAPQTSGMIFCFEPDDSPEEQK